MRRDAPGLLGAGEHSLYLLYWYKSTNTDAAYPPPPTQFMLAVFWYNSANVLLTNSLKLLVYEAFSY